ncbi:MAG TPA: PD-(D/E)XK nuclease family protein [Candidatus Paceibacterota bacterium]
MEHISFSQFSTYSRCPRSWYLGKVAQGEEKQTWYIPIGSAVHDMIEDHLDLMKRPEYRVENQRAEDFFYPLIEKQMLIEPDLSKWMAGGPQADPVVEEKALQKVTECFERACEELEAVDVWEVEYNASGRLPGLSIPIKAYVDIIGEHKKKGPVILDWKTGSTKPDNFQLETYAALLMENGYGYGGNMFGSWQGRYMMVSPTYTSSTRYVDLSKVDSREVAEKYQAVVDRIEGKHYEAKAGFNCRFCFQQENCLVNKGMTPRAVYYDKSEEEGYPF